jgi:hypothetical protein
MPITVVENKGLRRIEVLVQKVGDASLLELCEKLAAELVQDLSTVPWGGNIKRGLTYMAAPRKTPTGGWMIGVGSLDILHRDKAPPGTISAFLEWYRARLAEQKKQRAKEAAAARDVRAKKKTEVRDVMRVYRRAVFDDIRINRARDAGTLTKDMIRREEALYKEFMEAERKLETIMSAAAYERYTARYDRFLEAERKRRKRRYG